LLRIFFLISVFKKVQMNKYSEIIIS
jgi:hypothetical protein